MSDAWEKLQTATVRIDADKSKLETDRANARKLGQDCEQGNWETFYEGLDALERGCGYSGYSELVALCKTAGQQNDRRLLQIIEQKTKMMDIVLFLRSVDPAIKLAWINNRLFTKMPVLFECLRQALKETGRIEPQVDIIVKGLCDLQQKTPKYFRYLLDRNIIYKENVIPLASKLLECLQEEGWTVLSQCVTFDSVTQDRMEFWDRCAGELNWDIVHRRAGPLLDAWGAYMARSLVEGHYRQSLYCDVSNLLITILIYKLGTVEQYFDAMERALCAGEMAMYRWYEREAQQFGALIACLSIIEHLRYVWMNNSAAYDEPFPKKLRDRGLTIIGQWRYLWASSGKEPIAREILQQENWLKGVSAA